MKPIDFINEDFVTDAHEAHQDHEVQMARSDCYSAAKYAIELHKMLKSISEQQGLDGWVSEKITLANDYLRTVHEYLTYEQMSHVSSMPGFDPQVAEMQIESVIRENANPADIWNQYGHYSKQDFMQEFPNLTPKDAQTIVNFAEYGWSNVPNRQEYRDQVVQRVQQAMSGQQGVAEGGNGYEHGFADPNAPKLGGRRKDDEYVNGNPVNNIEVSINGRPWKIFPGKGPDGSKAFFQQKQDVDEMCKRKTAETGKKWSWGVTGEASTNEGQLELNTPDPVVTVQDAKGNILDTVNLSVAAQKYSLGNPQNIKTQLAHQSYTKIGNYTIAGAMGGQPQDQTTTGQKNTFATNEAQLDELSWKDIQKGAKKVSKGAKKFTKNVADTGAAVGDAASAVGGAIKQVGKTAIADPVSATYNAAKSGLNKTANVAKGVYGDVKKGAQAVGQATDTVATDVGNAGTWTGDKIKQAGRGVANVAGGTVGAVGSVVGGATTGAARAAAHGFNTGVQNVGGDAVDRLQTNVFKRESDPITIKQEIAIKKQEISALEKQLQATTIPAPAPAKVNQPVQPQGFNASNVLNLKPTTGSSTPDYSKSPTAYGKTTTSVKQKDPAMAESLVWSKEFNPGEKLIVKMVRDREVTSKLGEMSGGMGASSVATSMGGGNGFANGGPGTISRPKLKKAKK
jgi:hypothetical protein